MGTGSAGLSPGRWSRSAWRTARRWPGLAGQGLLRLWQLLTRTWQRSLQFRVVSVTLLLAVALVGAFSLTVASVVTRGLLRGKLSASEELVREGARYAESQLKVVNQPDDPALALTVPGVVAQLASTPDLDQATRVEVVMDCAARDLGLSPELMAQPDAGARAVVMSGQLAQLRRMVSGHGAGHGRLTAQYVTAALEGGERRNYLVFGTPVAAYGVQLELYYLFPLDEQVGQVNLVRTTLVVTTVTLVAMLALLAAMMTRMVVRPVRIAARTAQRLSAGLLDQRMTASGEDDLAHLAAAFNQMAANLQYQIIRLEEMSRLQRRFTSDVSHELRTPLTTVRMAADMIYNARRGFDPAVARSAELLQAELDRFEGLLADLLEISRFDAGFASLESEPADLAVLIGDVVARLAPLARRAGSVVSVRHPDSPIIIEIDARRVKRILRNLLGNALEHGEGRPVTVTVAADDSTVAVAVRDRGIGLKPGEEELVFNRFWRADPSRARKTGGTGLGLSISLEDARLHGGRLRAWGAPGRGAQFLLTLPIRAGERVGESPLPLVPPDADPDAVTVAAAGTDPDAVTVAAAGTDPDREAVAAADTDPEVGLDLDSGADDRSGGSGHGQASFGDVT